MKKKVLTVLSGLLVVLAALAVYSSREIRATPDERARTLAGDNLIPQPIGSVNHAITIRRSPHDVWPWLAQMGSGRAGWYAYDFIDNGGHRSAERVLPEFQNVGAGTVFPALPGAKDVFVVAQCDPEHSLVLSWRLPNGQYQTTWAFVLEQPQPSQTRLIVRGRAASGYRPFGLPEWFAVRAGRLAHFIMERKQLLGIARRAQNTSKPMSVVIRDRSAEKAKETSMSPARCIRLILRWFVGAIALVVVMYTAYVGVAWLRFGHPARPASAEDADPLLDRFMPTYEVAERHHVRVAAPAEITLAAASELDLRQSAIIRGIFKTRRMILRGMPEESQRPQAFVAELKAGGWGALAEVPGREMVFGAVTQPWMSNVVFRALPPDEFASFHEPGYAKIVWTMRADPTGPAESVFRTETRVVTTDPVARWKFRRYWSVFSPGIVLIRIVALGLVKTEAERRTGTHKPENVARRAEA